MALKIYAFNGFVPGAPNGQILSETPDGLLRNAGLPITSLPADGTYFTNNGGQSTYTGTPGVSHFENSLNWDSIKNFKISGLSTDLGGNKLEVFNYVHVDIALTDVGGGTSDNILVEGAKRGRIETNGGNDRVEIGNTSNSDLNPGFSDRFGIDTGSGSDVVIIRGASPAGVVNSPYTNYEDGHSTSVLADLGSGNDSFDSTGGISDTVTGATAFKSSDTVDGGSGNDTITTGDNSDQVIGGSGNDIINTAGHEIISTIPGGGMSDNDTVDGGSGNDYIVTGDGDDVIDGNSGSDTIYAGNGNDDISAGAGSGVDWIDAGAGNDTVTGHSGSDTVYGGAGNDVITSDSGSDWIDGGDDNDLISTGSGNDTVYGGTGSDTIMGGSGTDALFGGAGNDFFVFEAGVSSSKELIKDFVQGSDKIDVSALGITLAYLDTNNDTFVDKFDAHASFSGGKLDVNLGSGNHAVIEGFSQLSVSDFIHA